MNDYQKKYRDDPLNRPKYITAMRKYWQKIRNDVLLHYSGGKLVCAKCGFADVRALTIDHINGNGYKEKGGRHRSGAEMYRFLRRQNYPDGFQVLCMNCQFIKAKENKEHWTYHKVN